MRIEPVEIAIITAVLFMFSIMFIGVNVKRQILNREFNTNYTYVEYFFAEKIIKDYINTGEQKTYNVVMQNK